MPIEIISPPVPDPRKVGLPGSTTISTSVRHDVAGEARFVYSISAGSVRFGGQQREVEFQENFGLSTTEFEHSVDLELRNGATVPVSVLIRLTIHDVDGTSRGRNVSVRFR